MTCSRCGAEIETALRAPDAVSEVAVDLESKRVSVSSSLPEASMPDAMCLAGYEAVAEA